jgi:hypothetical protein
MNSNNLDLSIEILKCIANSSGITNKEIVSSITKKGLSSRTSIQRRLVKLRNAKYIFVEKRIYRINSDLFPLGLSFSNIFRDFLKLKLDGKTILEMAKILDLKEETINKIDSNHTEILVELSEINKQRKLLVEKVNSLEKKFKAFF